MNRIVSINLILLAVLLSQALGVSLEDSFKNPPMAYKSQPLWHMNGEMTTEGIKQQLRDAWEKSGFSGVAVLPVRETRPNYLSEDYFARYQDILETCKDLGMEVIFYDDIGFPSGSAGGQMRELYPDHILCRLDKLEVDVTGPTQWMQVLPTGDHMAAVAMNLTTFERHNIPESADGKSVKWKVPPGSWKLMVFTCVRDRDNKVDYLCPESVDKFFSLTYDKYYERFADSFGTTIQMTFFDDVGLRKASRRNWTPAFNVKFKQKHGYAPTLLYPALWHDIGPDTAAARVALYGFRAELLAEGFPRKVQEWAHRHGVRSSGHAMAQYHPQPTFLAGDNILFYRHSDIPMIDSIHYYGHGRPGFKLTSSAACSFDKPLTSVEIYGNYRGHFDTPMLYRSGMELFVRGANVFLPHGMWYVPEKMRIRPLISDFNPDIAADLAGYNDWVVNHQAYQVLVMPGSRVIHWSNLQKIKAFYEAGGKIVATTALPSQSAEFGHDKEVQQTIEYIFGIASVNTSLNEELLTHPNANGGLACFVLDFLQDRTLLDQALNLACPAPDVRFRDVEPTIDPGKGMLSYLHKVKDGRHVYFVANSADAAVDTEVTLRGQLALQSWDPHDGTMQDIQTTSVVEKGMSYTKTSLKMNPLSSLFLVEVQ